jgi:hypothetical protein
VKLCRFKGGHPMTDHPTKTKITGSSAATSQPIRPPFVVNCSMRQRLGFGASPVCLQQCDATRNAKPLEVL